eukprot:8847134-Prorocentrum_lima.AAC.1
MTEIAGKIGTWGHNAQEYWMKTVQQARSEHDDWLDLTPAQQAVREASYMFGDEFPIPPNGSTLENHLR